MDEGTATKTKAMLDEMHKSKIDMADEIYVINVDGYIGESTKTEVDYAEKQGKKVRYLVDVSTPEVKTHEAEANTNNYASTIESDYALVDSAINEARISEAKGEVVKSIRILWDALDKHPTKEQVQIIVRAIIGYCIDIGRTDKAEQFCKYAEDNYGKDSVLEGAYIRLATQKLSEGDKQSAMRYAQIAKSKETGTMNPLLRNVLIALTPQNYVSKKQAKRERQKRRAKYSINSTTKTPTRGRNDSARYKEILEEHDRKEKLRIEKQKRDAHEKEKERLANLSKHSESEKTKHSCNSCKVYKRGDCAGLEGYCSNYEHSPEISEEEKRNWPTEMGPYVTGYGNKRR